MHHVAFQGGIHARHAAAAARSAPPKQDALEADVVGLLMEALEQAFLGVSAEGKRKSLRVRVGWQRRRGATQVGVGKC